jgi:hypothetical protein
MPFGGKLPYGGYLAHSLPPAHAKGCPQLPKADAASTSHRWLTKRNLLRASARDNGIGGTVPPSFLARATTIARAVGARHRSSLRKSLCSP